MTNKTLTKAKTALQQTKNKPLVQVIEENMTRMIEVAPRHIDGVRFTSIARSLIKRTPKLSACDPYTVLASLYQCLSLGLEPIEGQAYILPFKNKGKLEAQFLIGYKGLVQLFYRHDDSVYLEWGVVHEKDLFDYEKGTAAYLRFKKSEGERGHVKGYYVLARLKNGGSVFDYMSHEACMEHGRKFSKTYDEKKGQFHYFSPWHKTPESMCLKTVLRNIMKLLPKSVEIQRALEEDETIKRFDPRKKAIPIMDELPDRTNWNELESADSAGPDVPADTETNLEQEMNEDISEGAPVSEEESPKEEQQEENNAEEVTVEPVFDPSSSDITKTKAETLRGEIVTMLLEMNAEDIGAAKQALKNYTSFGDFEGVTDEQALNSERKNGKRCMLEITHSKIKKDYLENR
jgi:recombination protein RecT